MSANYSRAWGAYYECFAASKESTEQMFFLKLSLEKFDGHRVTWLTGTEYLCLK